MIGGKIKYNAFVINNIGDKIFSVFISVSLIKILSISDFSEYIKIYLMASAASIIVDFGLSNQIPHYINKKILYKVIYLRNTLFLICAIVTLYLTENVLNYLFIVLYFIENSLRSPQLYFERPKILLISLIVKCMPITIYIILKLLEIIENAILNEILTIQIISLMISIMILARTYPISLKIKKIYGYKQLKNIIQSGMLIMGAQQLFFLKSALPLFVMSQIAEENLKELRIYGMIQNMVMLIVFAIGATYYQKITLLKKKEEEKELVNKYRELTLKFSIVILIICILLTIIYKINEMRVNDYMYMISDVKINFNNFVLSMLSIITTPLIIYIITILNAEKKWILTLYLNFAGLIIMIVSLSLVSKLGTSVIFFSQVIFDICIILLYNINLKLRIIK
jgi:hypothetical protein